MITGIRVITVMLLLAGVAAHASQHWGCTPGTTWSGEAKPVLWLSISSNNTGTVQMKGSQVDTTYAQTGLNRTWYWGVNEDGIYEHSVSLRGDGVALYFDFTARDSITEDAESPPPEFFACREFSPRSKLEIEGRED